MGSQAQIETPLSELLLFTLTGQVLMLTLDVGAGVGDVPAGRANRALIICARTKWTGGRLRVLSIDAVVIARVESCGWRHERGTVTPLKVHCGDVGRKGGERERELSGIVQRGAACDVLCH